MPISKPPLTAGRAPQRSNGIKRREALLNAAAQIITEAGLSGLTLHATARRARSSIGSVYHFFSDKDQLLDALRGRHRQDMSDIMGRIAEISTAEWKAMSTAEVINSLFGRPILYYSAHPYALQLHQVYEGQAVDAFLELVENVMTIRLGSARGPKIAKILFAMSTGALAFMLDVQNAHKPALVGEIPSVLEAYLAAQEAQALKVISRK